MTRIITLYGLLSGLIVSGSLILTCSMMRNGAPESMMMAVGFGFMLLAFVLMFVAVHQYRKTLPDRKISFGKAFKIAGLIALITSLFYAFTWLIIYYNFYPEFLDDYYKRQIAGKSSEQIVKIEAEREKYRSVYSHWYGILVSAMFEILPVGIVVALICAAVFSWKRNKPQVANRS